MSSLTWFRHRSLSSAAIVAVILAAYGLSMWGGSLGCFVFDQSIIFDGAWRILCGQIPFKDFISPVGPVPFYMQAAFFKVFGITHFAYRIHAAIINAVVSGLVMLYLSWILPGRRWLWVMAGLLTAIWYYAPLGTPWYSQTSVFFGVLGLGFVLSTRYFKNPFLLRSRWAQVVGPAFWAAPCMVLSFLTKQNSGAMFLLMPLILFWIPPRKSDPWVNTAAYIFGLLVSVAAVAGSIHYFASFELFWNHMFALPWSTLFVRLAYKKYISKTMLFHVPFTLLVLSFLFWKIIRKIKHIQYSDTGFLAFLFFGGFLFHLGMITTSTSDAFINIPFIGILFALAFQMIDQWALQSAPDQNTRKWLWIRSSQMALVVLFCGLGISMIASYRLKGHEAGQRLLPPIASGPLKGLRWNEPSSMITLKNLQDILQFMQATREPVYLTNGFTMLYGMTGHQSIDPFLWYHQGLSFPDSYSAEMESLDRQTLQRIIKLNPKYMVFAQYSLDNPQVGYLAYFRQVRNYFYENYAFASADMGPYLILYQRKNENPVIDKSF